MRETFIINEKNPAGGKSYKEYTWKEVLEWFAAPEDLDDVEELAGWYEKEMEMAFNYDVELWHTYDDNGNCIKKAKSFSDGRTETTEYVYDSYNKIQSSREKILFSEFVKLKISSNSYFFISVNGCAPSFPISLILSNFILKDLSMAC